MGVCIGKGAVVKEVLKENGDQGGQKQQSRRAKDGERVHAWQQNTRPGSTEGLSDFFSGGGNWSYVSGVTSDDPQEGYADKVVTKSGEGVRNKRIGYACKKGLRAESPNQDDLCIVIADNFSIYAVFDGHGPYGHNVANFAQRHLPQSFIQNQHFSDKPEDALAAAFPEVHRLCIDGQAEGRFDCSLSGATATLAMHRDGQLFVGHVGDCQAVVARRKDGELKAEEIVVPHRPSNEAECQRIEAAGGQVRRLEGDLPHRVFLAGKMYPGLAMTRSIGDIAGVEAGVISTPDVRCVEVEQDWRFLLLASDGIWEFINPQEAVEIVGKHAASSAQKAAECLAQEAWDRWIKEEETVVDDITVVCAWFHED